MHDSIKIDAASYKLMERLSHAETYFSNSKKYKQVVKESRRLFDLGANSRCSQALDELPTVAQLVESLVEKLRGKSVHKTIRKILNETESKDQKLEVHTRIKGLSSLLTHAVIEMEKNPEYACVAKTIMESLNHWVFSL